MNINPVCRFLLCIRKKFYIFAFGHSQFKDNIIKCLETTVSYCSGMQNWAIWPKVMILHSISIVGKMSSFLKAVMSCSEIFSNFLGAYKTSGHWVHLLFNLSFIALQFPRSTCPQWATEDDPRLRGRPELMIIKSPPPHRKTLLFVTLAP